jgi:hypothetical protein
MVAPTDCTQGMSRMTKPRIVEAAGHPVEIVVAHGATERVEIAAGGRAAERHYKIVADMRTPDGDDHRSNTVLVDDGGKTITAWWARPKAGSDLEIVVTPGREPGVLIFISHCPYPVTFTVTIA